MITLDMIMEKGFPIQRARKAITNTLTAASLAKIPSSFLLLWQVPYWRWDG